MPIEKISSRQLTWLILALAVSTPTLMMPGTVIFYAQQNAWLALLVATCLVTPGILLCVALAKRFPNQSVSQYAQALLGKWPGKLVGVFYSLMTLITGTFSLRSFAELFQITTMPETPLWIFVTCLALLATYAAWHGLEPIARINDMFLPFMILTILIVLCFALPQGKLYHALPTMQIDLGETIKGIITPFGYLAESSLILFLAPALNKPEQLKKATLTGLFISGLLLIIFTQAILFVLGVYRAASYFSPLLIIAQELLILDVFERMEPLLLSAWVTIMIIKISLFFYAFALSTAHTFNLTHYRKVLIPALVIIPWVALLPKNFSAHRMMYVVPSLKFLAPLILFVVPGILLITAKVKKTNV